METRYFATPINKERFHITEIHDVVEDLKIGKYCHLLKDSEGDEYVSSSNWSFNYSVYDDDVDIDFQGSDVTNEYKREYVFEAGVLNIYHPKKVLVDPVNNIIMILTNDRKIYRIKCNYIYSHKYHYKVI